MERNQYGLLSCLLHMAVMWALSEQLLFHYSHSQIIDKYTKKYTAPERIIHMKKYSTNTNEN